jgi:predicted nucleotidyltransferase
VPTEEQLVIIEQAQGAFVHDPRVRAAWIEGSIARGTEDAASDLDLHITVADDELETFGEATNILARIARPLGYIETMLPGVRLIAAAVAGPVRLDLYIEQRSRIATTARHSGRRMLFDYDEVERDLAAAPVPRFQPRQHLETLMRGYWFGAMWPGRFMLREDWGGLFMNATNVVYQFVVPALLIADASPEFYREQYARSRFLAPARSEAVRQLLDEAAAAFRGIGSNAPNLDAVKGFHLHLLTAVWSAFRQACAAVGIEYATDVESEYRAYYDREFGIVIPEFV